MASQTSKRKQIRKNVLEKQKQMKASRGKLGQVAKVLAGIACGVVLGMFPPPGMAHIFRTSG